MEGIISSHVSIGEIGTWVCIAFIVGMLISKLWDTFFPKIQKKIMREVQLDQTDADIIKRLDEIEINFKGEIKDIKSQISRIDEKLDNDNNRIHNVEKKSEKLEKLTMDSLEEREILMHSVLAVLKGLQEIGANGPTKEAQKRIEDYLTKKAHEGGY